MALSSGFGDGLPGAFICRICCMTVLVLTRLLATCMEAIYKVPYVWSIAKYVRSGVEVVK